MVLKTFIFQFVNSFNSLAYIAFIKTYVEGCLATEPNGDHSQLSVQAVSMSYFLN